MNETWLLSHIPPSGSVAVDVGANTGEWSRLLASRFIRVIAFEPIETPRVPENVTVHQVAVGADTTDMVLHVYADSAHTSRYTDADLETRSRGEPRWDVTVPTVTLDSLVPEADFVKIDVEGCEYAVLQGAPQLLASRPHVVVEVHSSRLREDCTYVLEEFGLFPIYIPHPYPEAGKGHGWLVA